MSSPSPWPVSWTLGWDRHQWAAVLMSWVRLEPRGEHERKGNQSMGINIATAIGVGLLAGPCLAVAQMDQINATSGLFGEVEYGIMQVFPDFPSFSACAIDDFVNLGSITAVSAAFELSNDSFFALLPSRVQGWRLSFFANVESAGQSGWDLNQNAVATRLTTSAVYHDLGVVNGTRAYRVDFLNLDLQLLPGTLWVGVAAVMPFQSNEQLFLLGNSQPLSRGGGQANNAHFVNPGNQFGIGRTYDLGIDAAIAVQTVPEPATLAGLLLGLGLLRRRVRA